MQYTICNSQLSNFWPIFNSSAISSMSYASILIWLFVFLYCYNNQLLWNNFNSPIRMGMCFNHFFRNVYLSFELIKIDYRQFADFFLSLMKNIQRRGEISWHDLRSSLCAFILHTPVVLWVPIIFLHFPIWKEWGFSFINVGLTMSYKIKTQTSQIAPGNFHQLYVNIAFSIRWYKDNFIDPATGLIVNFQIAKSWLGQLIGC